MKKNYLLRIVIVVFGVFLLYSLIKTQNKIDEKREQLNELKQEIDQTRIENEELQKTIDSYGTDEFIEEQARDILNYADSNEHFYIDVSGSK